MNFFLFCKVFSILYTVQSVDVPIKLIADYFDSVNIKSITVLICSRADTKIRILKELSREGFLVSFSINSITYFQDVRTGGVLDLSCDFTPIAIEKFRKEKTMGMSSEWLVLDDGSRLDVLKEAYILPGSSVTVAQLRGDSVDYLDVYRTSVFRPLKYSLLARQRVDDFRELPVRPNRTNFEGITLLAGSAFYWPEKFCGYDCWELPEVDVLPKVGYPITRVLQDQLNFTSTYISMTNYGWQTNMTFSGLVGMLQREELDMGAVGLFMRADRSHVVDFTGDTFELKTRLIYKQPALSAVSNIFVLPFDRMVWICCCGLAVVAGLCLMVDVGNSFGNRQAFEGPVNMLDVIIFIIGCICQQGTSVLPKSVSTRIIIFLFSLSCIFIYTSYAANIVALLQSSAPTLRTLSDIVKSPLKVGIQDIFYNTILLGETNDPGIKDFIKKKVAHQGDKAYIPPEVGMEKVRTGMFAYDVETQWAYKIISDTFHDTEKCDLDEIRIFLLPTLSVPVVKKSGYREYFTRMNTRQRDVGLHSRVRRRWLPKKPTCTSNSRGFVSVGLTDFEPALLVMIYGFCVSTAVFLAEIIVKLRLRYLSKESRKDKLKLRRIAFEEERRKTPFPSPWKIIKTLLK